MQVSRSGSMCKRGAKKKNPKPAQQLLLLVQTFFFFSFSLSFILSSIFLALLSLSLCLCIRFRQPRQKPAIPNLHDYGWNAGLIVLKHDGKVFEQLLEYWGDLVGRLGKCIDDQELLWSFFSSPGYSLKLLPSSYNVRREVREDALIFHFAGSWKVWHSLPAQADNLFYREFWAHLDRFLTDLVSRIDAETAATSPHGSKLRVQELAAARDLAIEYHQHYFGQ